MGSHLLLFILLSSWYSYYLPWDDSTQSVIHIGRRFNNKNKVNRIYAGNHFYDATGERVRFFGASFCFGAAFPAHGDAHRIANRLHKFGFNIVRLHHIDSAWFPEGILDPNFWPATTQLSNEALDRLDYFINELANLGIYVDLNLHVGRPWSVADGIPNADSLPIYGKYVLYYDSQLQSLFKDYVRELLTHYNSYRGYYYYEDPAIAFLELTNENSIISAWIHGFTEGKSGTHYDIREPYRSKLDTLWNEWLLKQYGTRDSLYVVWSEGTRAEGPERIRNGDFEEKPFTDWVLEVHSWIGAKAEFVWDSTNSYTGNKCARIRVDSIVDYSWRIQFKQIGQNIEEAERYILSFAAKASHERNIYVAVCRDTSPWDNFGLWAEVELNTSWNSYSLCFRSNVTDSGATRISFILGGDTGFVWLDTVSYRTTKIIGLEEDEDSANLTVRRIGWDSSAIYTENRCIDMVRFYTKLEIDFFQEMHSFIHDTLGCLAPINTTQNYYCLTSIYTQSLGNYINAHSYWNHPIFPDIPWDPKNWYIYNTPMLPEVPNAFTRLTYSPIKGKPFAVTEYNQPHPNFYQSEMVPELVAYSGLQDWDAVIFYCYHHRQGAWNLRYMPDHFAVDTDPKVMSQFIPWALAFRRGDIQPASEVVSLIYSLRDVYRSAIMYQWNEGLVPTDKNSENTRMGLIHKIERAGFTSDTTPLWQEYGFASPSTPYVSDTDELMWDTENGLLKINAPRVIALVGFSSGQHTIANISFNISTNFSSITLISLNDRAISEADTLLLVAVARSFNTNMGWNSDSTSVDNNWGEFPVLMQRVDGTITFQGQYDSLRVFALDSLGFPYLEMSTFDTDDGVSFNIGENTPWYLILPYRTVPCDDCGDERSLWLKVYPNPFTSEVNFKYSLPIKSKVVLKIYNLSGQRVKSLIQEQLQPGIHFICWDGKDINGERLSTGLYFYCFQCNKVKMVGKLVLLK